MQVRKFESPEWWTRSIYSMSTAERNMAEWVAGEPKVTPYRSGLYEEDELKLLAKTFGDCKEYFDVGYSDYGGTILDRLVCDNLRRIHDKPDNELTAKERSIIEGCACLGSCYGGEQWVVWHHGLLADLKIWNTELYSRGLDWVYELFGGDWEDALTEVEQKLYDEAWDFLVESYPALKGEDELEEKIRSWFEVYGHVMPTFVDHSENRLMKEVGAFVLDNHTAQSNDHEPFPFHWMKDEWNKAMKDADELPDAESQVKMHKQIDAAYDKALEQLGYAFANGNAEEWSEENKDFGWLPWNKSEE